VLYLTERASSPAPEGLELFELAPGIELQRDVLDQMDFRPLIADDLRLMPAGYFLESDPLGLEA
jgi:acyl CoA:acetate/3-ketoacid CoA transferase